MDDTEEPPITENEIQFLKFAYSIIKERGELIEAYTEDELFQVQSLLASSVMLNRADIISEAGISEGFVETVEDALEKMGYTFI